MAIQKHDEIRPGPETGAEPFTLGELLVHVSHGVCRYQGTRVLPTDGGLKPFLQLEFASGDRIYVPIEHVGRLSRHTGEDAALARLPLQMQPRAAFNKAKPGPASSQSGPASS